MQKKSAAIATLEHGAHAFPEKPEFERMRIFYLIDLHLYAAAADVSRHYLQRKSVTEEDYVAIGEALRTARDYKGAELILEGARLRYPESEKIVVQLAHAYLDAGQKIASAMLFEEASLTEPKYAFESAELYKESGQTYRATWLNARVADQVAKTKQRLSLLVDAEDFEAVLALEPKLSRLGLLSDQSVRYAVAYAAFKTGQFAEAEQHLRKVTNPELLDSALQLRKAIETCREAGWECAL
jgi:predicted Zn-dependent protease